jgi:hypothetical protein
VLNSHFQEFGPVIETELFAKSISGMGMPRVEDKSSHSEEEQIGRFAAVTVQPARDIEREVRVVVSV